MAKEKFINWRMVSAICAMVVALGGVLTFLVRWNMNQDVVDAGLNTDVGRVEASYEVHVRSSEECFRKLDRTLDAQQKLIAETRETMSAVRATQVSIKEENGRLTRSVERLAEEIRRANGGPK